MGKTLGIDRDLARKIKRMSRKELDGYLTRVTDKSYNNGYEQGLEAVLKEETDRKNITEEKAGEIKKAVGTYIAKVPEKASEKAQREGEKDD